MDHDLRHMFTKEFWDQRYAGREHVWSGQPNPRLVEQISGIAPTTALDVGCGEGADVVWLAQQGWRVTGVDVSEVALERAEAHAKDAGLGLQTAFVAVDVVGGEELPRPVDLVTAQYLHAPPEAFDLVMARMGGSLNHGGLLLMVGHHPDDAATGLRNPELASLLFTPEEVVATLPPDQWDVRVAEAATRPFTTGDGREVTVTDTVVLALRR